MKNVGLALICSLGLVACGGESRRAEDPSTATSRTSTTSNTSTSTNGSGPAASDFHSKPADWNAASASNAETSRVLPSTSGDARATAPATTGAAPAGDGAANNAPVVDNPGVADGTKDATNTKTNDRDRHGAVTPTDQGGGNDRDITAAIRRAVVADGALSFTAKNVKIVVTGGKVTLRGPVKSDAEKSSIEAKAKSTSGVSEVDNQLEVKK